MPIRKQITRCVAVGLAATCGFVQAQGYLLFTNQTPAGASWFTAENWRFRDAPNAQIVPTITNSAYISTSVGPGTAIVDGPGGVTGSVLLGWATGHQANLKIVPGGELYVQGACYVGYQSPAQLEITGGVISGLGSMYIGHYPRAGVPCEVEVLHYAGSVMMTNGTNASIFMNKDPGTGNYATGFPRYKLMGGMLQCSYFNLGCKGYSKFEVEGGTNKVTNYIRVGQDIGGDGVYLQSGGHSSCYWMVLGASGAQGHSELSGGTFTGNALFCGYGGNGAFIQSGGTNNSGTTQIGGYTTGTGSGIYKISGGRLAAGAITVSTNGTFEITGSNSVISCTTYTQTAQSTLDLRLTNGVISPIALTWSAETTLNGTLNVTLQGSPDFYPSTSSVVTVMTSNAGYVGKFKTINLAPANKLIGVRVNYNAKSITLDQWKYAPEPITSTFQGPFQAEALVFYFVHPGGPLQLQAEILGDQAAAVVRFFDTQENLRLWKYCRPQAGGHVVTYDFGPDAPAGIYQLRASGNNYRINPKATPVAPFGVMAASCNLYSSTQNQFADISFLIPQNAEKFSWSGLGFQPKISNASGLVTLPVNGEPLDVRAHRGDVWAGRFIIAPDNYSRIGFEHMPVILCPDSETARQINGSLEQTDDGIFYPHKFQTRIHAWLENQKTADLSLPIVDLRQLKHLFAAETNHLSLLGGSGVFTYINTVLQNQNIDPNSEQFGDNYNTALLAIVNSLDKPFNPYFKRLEKRLLIPALRYLLTLQENDSFKETADNYGGTWAMSNLAKAQELAEGYAQISDQEALGLWRDGIRRLSDRFSMFRVSCENQSAHWPLIYYYLYQGIGELGYKQLAEDFIADVCLPDRNPFMQTGYQQEAYGPDASYQGLSTCIQAAYFRLCNDSVSLDGLRRIFDFFNHTVVPEPDGSVVGACNFSHRTKMSWANAQYGAGIPLLQGVLPEAACLARPKPVETKSLETLLMQPTYFIPAAIGYATAPFGSYFNGYRFPSEALPGAKLPVLAENNFTRDFNSEFLAWRRPGFYAFSYIGQTAGAWVKERRKQYPENTPDEASSTKWQETQGLSVLWFEKYGAFILGKNWNAYTGQFLRGELPDGRCAYPDYWGYTCDYTDQRFLLQSKLFQAESCVFSREMKLLKNGVRQNLSIEFTADSPLTSLYEQLPILLKGNNPLIEFLVDGTWVPDSGLCQAIRFNNKVTITFDQPRFCSFGPETNLYAQRIACLLIHLGNTFKMGDTVALSYTITEDQGNYFSVADSRTTRHGFTPEEIPDGLGKN